ncbi:MAG: beta-lactamase family protein [Candidatus Rokubacteria bacterium]|nr:beta-lactamase family protein [Candidatus Rokubacteria bacterium]
MAFKDKVDSLLRKATDSGDVPGVVVMLTDRNGTTYEGGFGRRVLGQGAAMSPDTVVWIASMSKAFTSTAAMQLVERGSLELDAPASKWAPHLAQVKVLEGFDASGQAKLRAPTSQITLRHLLTHTAGFGYDIWSADLARFQEKNGIPGIISCQNAALTTPLLFDPGTRWLYGINIDWAGKLVEAASGVKLGAYLKDNVFGLLGINDTAFKISASMRQRLAKIHQRGDDGSLAPQMELEIPQEPEFEMGGGGLYGTASDYLKFVRMILNRGKANGKQVLKPETVDQMCANNMGGLRVQVLKTVMPTLSHDAEFFPGMQKSWGLAFQRNEAKAPTGLPAGSLMWAGLANTFYWIDPSSGIGGVYLSQVLPFIDVKSFPLFLEFQKAAYQ